MYQVNVTFSDFLKISLRFRRWQTYKKEKYNLKLIKKSVILAILAITLLITPALAMKDSIIMVTFDNSPMLFEVDPIIYANNTLVQVRPIFERMGLEVIWDNEQRTITGIKEGLTITLPIDSTTAYVNGKSIILQVPAKIVNEVTVVPIRFVSEASGYKVAWDNSSRTVIIQSPDGTKPDQLIPTEAGVYNVKNFGAKGDGTTDDTTAVQKTLNAVSKVKGTVYFPKGTYLINATQSLTVKANTKLTGDGTSTIIKAKSGGQFASSLMTLSGSSIQISHINLDGNNAVINILLVDSGSSNVQIDNCSVANASQSSEPSRDDYNEVVTGIYIYGNTNTITIDQTEIYNIKAIHENHGSLVARGIYLTENKSGWHEKAAKNVSITNNYIHDIGPADDGDGIFYDDPNLVREAAEDTNSIIADNRFANCAKRAIKINAQGIRITGNHIMNNYLNNNYYQGKDKGTLAPDMYAGISVYANNNVVSNNILEGIGSYYAAIEVSAERTVNNIIVSNNKVTMGANSNLGGKTAIRLGNVDTFTITLNELENGETGIWTWQSASNGIIKENKINIPGGTGINLETYLPDTYKRDIQVANNTINN
jgi:hypothetical protein